MITQERVPEDELLLSTQRHDVNRVYAVCTVNTQQFQGGPELVNVQHKVDPRLCGKSLNLYKYIVTAFSSSKARSGGAILTVF